MNIFLYENLQMLYIFQSIYGTMNNGFQVSLKIHI